MTRVRLILLGALGALVMLAMACSSPLPGGDDDGDSDITAGNVAAQAEGIEEQLALGDGGQFNYSDEAARGSVLNAELADGDGEFGAAAPPGQPASEVDDGAPPVNPQLGGSLDRKIIQSTSIDLEIEGENGVSRSFQDIIRIAETAGGFVASSSFSNIDDKQFADVTIRVPGTQYQSVLADIRGMGTVSQEGSDANDITEEYTDLQARLRTLNATEQRYLELLARAETINEILVVQDRLDVVRGQIEQVIGRINLLDNLTELATITAHLSPAVLVVEPSSDGGSLTPAEAFENAWQASLTALSGIAIAAVVVVAFSWWLVPPLVALAIGARWWANRRPRATATSSAS